MRANEGMDFKHQQCFVQTNHHRRNIFLLKILMEQMSDDLLNKLSFSICDLKTVIYFLKTTNVIKEFSQCVLLCDQIQKSMSNYDITVESTSNL